MHRYLAVHDIRQHAAALVDDGRRGFVARSFYSEDEHRSEGTRTVWSGGRAAVVVALEAEEREGVSFRGRRARLQEPHLDTIRFVQRHDGEHLAAAAGLDPCDDV